MKKLLLLFSILINFLLANAQVVTSSPSPLYNDSQNVVIYFHANEGDKGLMGVSSSTAIYAHTGVCVIDSDGKSEDWKYAPTWLTNTAKYKLEYVSTNLWKLNIGNLKEYYGVAPNETITRLCFVFRDANGNRSGRAAGGGDIFLDVDWGAPQSKPSTLTTAPAQGATVNADGSVTFCVAAPGKSSVMVLGSWNDYILDNSQMLEYIDQDVKGTVCRFFTITLPKTKINTSSFFYYYLVDGAIRVGDPYARLILDPDNDKYIPSSVFPNLPAYPSKLSGVSLAWVNPELDIYNWQTQGFTPANTTDLIIYELLIRDFTGTEGQSRAEGTIRGAIDKIPYLKSLGVNTVELMPIMEFSGNNSWGYNPNFYFAPDKAYGTPADYKEFIDLCHKNNIAVVLDIVFNQADGQHPWYRMYQQGENPFFNAVAPHAYSVLNDWNQGYPLVELQWKDVLQYWLKEYKVDGFRFDLVKGLGNNDSYANSGDAATNAYNQSRIDRMIRLHSYMNEVNPSAIFINEDLATAEEENAMAANGQLNWVNVNTEGRNYASGIQSNSGLNRMWAVDNGRTPGSTVAYLESHDEERLAYAAKTSSVAAVKNSPEVQFNRLGAAAAQMLLVPGSHMIWQFSELGNSQTTKNSNWSNNTDPKVVNWNLLNDPLNAGLLKNYKDLIAIRLNNTELFHPETGKSNFSMACQAANWVNGRTIICTNDTKEIYTAINPNTTSSITLNLPFRSKNNSDYMILSQSVAGTASYDAAAGTVTVPANGYICVGSTSVASVNDLNAISDSLDFIIDGNILCITAAHAAIQIYSVDGKLLQTIPSATTAFGTTEPKSITVELSTGIYLLRSGSQTKKIMIK